MPLSLSVRIPIVASLVATLAACSSGGSATNVSQDNPNFFLGRVADQAISGAYNSDGFSAGAVRTLVQKTCTGTLTGFGTQPTDNGLTAFTANCTAFRSGARAVEFERTSGGLVVIEITGSVNGNIVYDRINVTL